MNPVTLLQRAYYHIALRSMLGHQWYGNEPRPPESRYPLTFGELDRVREIISNAIEVIKVNA